MGKAVGRVAISGWRGAAGRWRPAACGVAMLAALAAGCADHVPRPRVPQLEQTTEAVHGGGERLRDHQACAKAATSVDDLVRCMDAAHWQFVARGDLFPSRDCWEARDRGELGRVAPHCFLRSSDHP